MQKLVWFILRVLSYHEGLKKSSTTTSIWIWINTNVLTIVELVSRWRIAHARIYCNVVILLYGNTVLCTTTRWSTRVRLNWPTAFSPFPSHLSGLDKPGSLVMFQDVPSTQCYASTQCAIRRIYRSTSDCLRVGYFVPGHFLVVTGMDEIQICKRPIKKHTSIIYDHMAASMMPNHAKKRYP